MTRWLGIDVGGANLKIADGSNFAKSVPFELWRQPGLLSEAIESLLADAPQFDALAATMTGELADCYVTKAAGVRHITEALLQANGDRRLLVYCVDGRFRAVEELLQVPLLAAASNWHALARLAARHLPGRTGLVVDIGSTTSDIIPVVRGEVATASQSDTERLLAGELVYSGVGRTPLCAIVRQLPYRGQLCPVSAELFATTLDVYRVLGVASKGALATADGRSTSVENCVDRLARQICADRETFSLADALQASQFAKDQQLLALRAAIAKVAKQSTGRRVPAIVSGSGEALAYEASLAVEMIGDVVALSTLLGEHVSDCAAAAAVACLAEEAK